MGRFTTRCILVCLLIHIGPGHLSAQQSPLDPSFGEDGQLTTALGRTSDQTAKKLVVLPNGSFLVLGEVSSGLHPAIALSRFLPSGQLDPTFGEGGTVVQWFPIEDDTIAHALIVQPDGKILVAAWIIHLDGLIIRFNADGSLDKSFGDEGIAYLNLSSLQDITLQPDGKIVATGWRYQNSNYDSVVWRLTADGECDFSFGQGGEALLTIDSEASEKSRTMTVRPDGRIVIAGQVSNVEAPGQFAIQLLSNGAFDHSFGNAGITVTSLEDQTLRPYALVLQPDGALLTSGALYLASDRAAVAVRYLPNGLLDTSFGAQGIAVLNSSERFEEARGIDLRSDGRIVLGGYTQGDIDNVTVQLIRLMPDGGLDPTFGDGGIAEGPFGVVIAQDMRLLSDNRILITGSTYGNGIALARYLEDGTPDRTFGIPDPLLGADGYIEVGGLGHGSDEAHGLIVLSDDRFLLVGISEDWIGCTYCINVLRYSADGTIDQEYGDDGVARVPGRPDAFLLLPDERLLLSNANADSLKLARLTEDGQPDLTFGEEGVVTLPPFNGGYFYPSALGRQTDGKLLVGGSFTPTGGVLDRAFAVVRVHSDGSRDLGFGNKGIAVTDVGPSNEVPVDVVELYDGRIVLGGSALVGNWKFTLVGHLPDGTLDTSFGVNGIRTAGYAGERNIMGSMIIQNGMLLTLGGYYVPNTDTSFFLLARFTANGDFDSEFGWNRAFLDPGFAQGKHLALQSDGRILATGMKAIPPVEYPYDYNFASARFMLDGSLDPSFGNNGEVLSLLDADDEGASGVGVQSTGRIIVAGSTGDGFQSDYTLVGYLPVTPTDSESAPELPSGPTTLSTPSPNPTVDRSIVTFSSAVAQDVTVSLIDMLGREITILYKGLIGANEPARIEVDVRDLPSGIYMLTATGEIMLESRMLTIVR